MYIGFRRVGRREKRLAGRTKAFEKLTSLGQELPMTKTQNGEPPSLSLQVSSFFCNERQCTISTIVSMGKIDHSEAK